MKEKLESLRKNILIELSSWAGLSLTPGVNSILITKDKKIYYYHQYHRIPISLEEKITKEGLTEGIKISDKKYQKLINIIKEKIINKNYEPNHIFDASFYIKGNYNNQNFNIINHPDLYNEIYKIIKGGK